MTDEIPAENNGRPYERQYFLKAFLRIYFIILFISTIIGLSFSRQIGAILIFSLVSSLMVFICCNCGQCFKTQVINGHVLVGPPGLASTLPRDQQIAYIIVTPRVTAPAVSSDEISEPPPPMAPLYPVYSNHFQPPPSYDESQRHYK